MNRVICIVLLTISATSSLGLAHRSGCHRWHSCPSDTGSYTCGDSGNCSQCPDNVFCENGNPKRNGRRINPDGQSAKGKEFTAESANMKPDYVFVDQECKVLGSVLNSSSVHQTFGSKTVTACSRIDSAKLLCTVSGQDNSEKFSGKSIHDFEMNIKSNLKGILELEGKDGNIVSIASTKTHSFNWGQVNIMPGGMLISKVCEGKFFTGQEINSLTQAKSITTSQR